MADKNDAVKDCCSEDKWKRFFEHLSQIGYSESTIVNFRWVVKHFNMFLHDNDMAYTAVAVEAFLGQSSKTYSQSTMLTIKSVLRRFDAFAHQTSLASRDKRTSNKCPDQFNLLLSEFLEYLKQRGCRPATIEDYRYNLLKILKKFDEDNVKNISLITPENVYALFQIKNRKRSFSGELRQFLRYLFKSKLLGDDYSVFVSSVRYSRPIPSVYTKSETEQLLNHMDLSSLAGKRDYTIILLALRLGIRTGDIANLKISDIDFTNKEINFIQRKTLIPQRLELLPGIEKALLSYFSTARPPSDIPNVFLTSLAPTRAVTPSLISINIRRYMKNAGINIGPRKSGAHALRMTLASELVAEKVPYDVVRKILGHEDPASIKHYVKFDIESLRSCSIKVPMLTGNLSTYINACIGGQFE